MSLQTRRITELIKRVYMASIASGKMVRSDWVGRSDWQTLLSRNDPISEWTVPNYGCISKFIKVVSANSFVLFIYCSTFLPQVIQEKI